MLIPYIRYPFVSQNPNTMYSQYPNEVMEQQNAQQYMYNSKDYPIPAPYEMYNDYDSNYMNLEKSRQQQPVLSNNPASVNITLFKELTAYPNYGNPSRNADILYTGNRGTWTFDIPAFLFIPGNLRARIIIRAVLDDHSSVPVNRYSARITINGSVVHNGRLNLVHGAPAGGMFTNWRELSYNITNMRRNTRVTIENTSTTGPNDWIAFDWMELRLSPR